MIILEIYKSSDAIISPIWLVDKYTTEIITTNEPEFVIICHYNTQFNTSLRSFYQVIDTLLNNQSKSYLKIYCIKQYNINKTRKEQIENITLIINTWEKYKNNEILLNKYLLTLGARFCTKKV